MVSKPSFLEYSDRPTDPRPRTVNKAPKAGPRLAGSYCSMCMHSPHSLAAFREVREAEEHQWKQELETQVREDIMMELKDEFLARKRQSKMDHRAREKKLKEEIEYLRGKVDYFSELVTKVNDPPSSINRPLPTLFTHIYVGYHSDGQD